MLHDFIAKAPQTNSKMIIHRFGIQIWAIYCLIAATIMAPLLVSGYIFSLDNIWTPISPVGDIMQKMIFIMVILAAGTGMHKLVTQKGESLAGYIGGLIYVVNPFTYTRFVTGQILVLVAYALLPWFVLTFWKLFHRPNWRHAIALTILAIGIGVASSHAIGFLIIISAILVIAAGWRRWGSVRRPLLYLAAAAGAWLAINAFWLVPFIRGQGRQAQAIAGFGPEQFAAYATSGGSVGVPLNVLSLQGFWADTYDRYVLPSATGALFWIVTTLIFALVVLGVWRSIRQRDRLGLALAATGLIGWILALGSAWSGTAWLNDLLVQYVPFYRGYREPHKWAMLLALAYAYHAAGGVELLRHRLSGWKRDAVGAVCLLLPLLWVPMLLWGAGGQLRSAQYPAGWAELDQRLSALPAGGIVVLPWHQYINLDFACRTVANPAPRYFHRPLISSDDPELIGLAHQSPIATNRQVQAILDQRFLATNAGPQFAAAGVRYIVLLKQADWQQYGWLDAQGGITVVKDAPDYRLYEVAE